MLTVTCVALLAAAALAKPLELTDASFKDIVMDAESGKQYFVKFYAPW